MILTDQKPNISTSHKVKYWLPLIKIPTYLPSKSQVISLAPVCTPGHEGFLNKSLSFPTLTS